MLCFNGINVLKTKIRISRLFHILIRDSMAGENTDMNN